jgi:hypothetical protein
MNETEVTKNFLLQQGGFLKSWLLDSKVETKEMKKKDAWKVIRSHVMKRLKKIRVEVLNK